MFHKIRELVFRTEGNINTDTTPRTRVGEVVQEQGKRSERLYRSRAKGRRGCTGVGQEAERLYRSRAKGRRGCTGVGQRVGEVVQEQDKRRRGCTGVGKGFTEERNICLVYIKWRGYNPPPPSQGIYQLSCYSTGCPNKHGNEVTTFISSSIHAAFFMTTIYCSIPVYTSNIENARS